MQNYESKGFDTRGIVKTTFVEKSVFKQFGSVSCKEHPFEVLSKLAWHLKRDVSI